MLAYAYYEGRTFTGGNNGIRIVRINYSDGIGSDNFLEGATNGIYQRAVGCFLHIFDKLHQNFSIGFAFEGAAMEFQSLFENVVILDRTVVDQRDLSVCA